MSEHPDPLTDDPRFEGLPAAVVECAKQAECSRCKISIVDQGDDRMGGTLFVSYYVPALGVRQRAFLCGACGLALREFLIPELETHPVYQQLVAEMRIRWT